MKCMWKLSCKCKVVKNLGFAVLNALFAFIFLGIHCNKIFRGKQIWIVISIQLPKVPEFPSSETLLVEKNKIISNIYFT